ncbi:MAG: hypothetical protein P4L50_05060 [Anaerolineaceae bacterium]|nr:hypothetical protein [Anaerolineaceae bacterium]
MRSNPMISLGYRVTLLILFIGTFITPKPVFADAAPPPPPPGSNPMQDNPNTRVQMISETVLFDLATAGLTNGTSAKVTATFLMHNQGSQDEGMSVRFPLGFTSGGVCYYSQFPPITDLNVRVNNVHDATTISNETVTTTSSPPQQVSIPCWAHFPVTFPVGKDVLIKVQYTAQSSAWKDMGGSGDESWGFGGDNPSAILTYDYVLETGAGWYGPIGSTSFVLRLPYEANQQNVYLDNQDKSWKMAGDKISWYNENFEPAGNLEINLVNPVIWQTILQQSQAVQKFPQDGGTWWRLATGYKQAIWSRRGFRADPAGLQMYTLSDQAYQKAIALLPRSADLHFGYAELLCWHAQWGYEADTQFTNPDWEPCLQQLKATLDISPLHVQANLALQTIGRFFPSSVDLTGSKPDFLLLTPQPGRMPEQDATVSPTQIPPTITATIPSTPTVEVRTPTLIPTQPALAKATAVQVAPALRNSPSYGTAVLVIVAFLIGIVFWSYKRTRH